jgi:hypothetical protein
MRWAPAGVADICSRARAFELSSGERPVLGVRPMMDWADRRSSTALKGIVFFDTSTRTPRRC